MRTELDRLEEIGSSTTAYDEIDFEAIGRDEGIERSSRTAGSLWFLEVTNMLKCLLAENAKICSDDLWALGLPPTKSPRALGAVMRNAVKQGWLQPIVCEDGEFICRQSVRRHKGLVQVWRSTLYKGTGDEHDRFYDF